jgi:hypothetical protein
VRGGRRDELLLLLQEKSAQVEPEPLSPLKSVTVACIYVGEKSRSGADLTKTRFSCPITLHDATRQIGLALILSSNDKCVEVQNCPMASSSVVRPENLAIV